MFLQCYYGTFHFFSYILPKGPVLGPTLNAGVAQQAEQLICNQQVDGSIPFASSMVINTVIVDINVHFVFPFIFLLLSQRNLRWLLLFYSKNFNIIFALCRRENIK